MEDEEIQNMESDEDTAPQQLFSVVVEQSPMRRGEEEGQTAVEPGMIQNVVSDDGDPDFNDVDQSTAVERSPVASDSKSVIQLTVALALVGGSFTMILAVPGGVNEAGRAVVGHTIAFGLLLVADMVALLTSLAVAMILATVSHISAYVEYLIRTCLWTAAVCFVLAFHGAAYVVVLPNHKWIVLRFGGAVTMTLALLLIYQFPMVFYQVSRTSTIGDGGMRFSDGFEGGHFSRDSGGRHLIKRRKI